MTFSIRFSVLTYVLSTESVKKIGVSFGLGNQQSKKILGAKIDKLFLNV